MAKKILGEVADSAVKELAKLRGVTREQIINEAVFWYLNFLGARIEQIESGIEVKLSEETIQKIAEAVFNLLKPQDRSP